jgi:hypothetical protein
MNQKRFKFISQNPGNFIYFTLKSQHGCRVKVNLSFIGGMQANDAVDISEARLNKDVMARLFTRYNPNSELTSTAFRTRYELEILEGKIVEELNQYLS